MDEKIEIKKLSEYYSEIFNVYLNFSLEYRRNIIDLEKMFNWIEEIDLKRQFSDKYDFFIFMEWFNALNLIKPFCIIKYPPEMFEGARLVIDTGNDNLKEMFEEGYIVFPEEIYDIRVSVEMNVKFWQYKKTSTLQDVQENLREYMQYDSIKYCYHPIQFFQVLTYLKGYSYRQLFKHKQYLEFYWRRRFLFNDYKAKEIKSTIKEKKKSVEDFIQEQISNGYGFNQFAFIFLHQNQWLLPKSLLIWLKIETLYGPSFYRPSNSHYISLNFQIPFKDRLKNKIFNAFLGRHNDWIKKLFTNFSDYFTKDDFYFIQEFRQRVELYLRMDGLENFVDLFLIIRPEKKRKLKGYLSYFVNIIQIVKTLRRFEGVMIEKIPDLEKEKKEPKWYEPKYYFESDEERIEYIKKLYLEYGLTQKDTYVIFVEGKTEKILLKDWIQIVHSRIHVKLDIQILPDGKKTPKLFEYITKTFAANEYFLILDADKENYIPGKKAQLKDSGINEDSFYIFFPDFITANYDQSEILKAFIDYFDEITKEIKDKTSEESRLEESDKKEIFNILNSKDSEDKYEELIENYLKVKLKNERVRLKKPLFAEKIKNNMIFEGKDRKIYLFEDIIGKFATKIQMKTFPEELKKKINKI